MLKWRCAFAYEAIARTLPVGSVGYEAKANEKGQRLIWFSPLTVIDRLRDMRGSIRSNPEAR